MPDDFETRTRDAREPTLVGEFLSFLKHNKKWWLLPIVLVLLLMGAMILLSATPAGPFIYTMF